MPGEFYEGVVIGTAKFGAFIELPSGEVGLVHISEVSEEYVKEVDTVLKKGDKVRVKVLTIKNDGKIELSIKQAAISFEDKMSIFKKQSEERLLDLKRSLESKRGGKKQK
ncbi:S1 RNA-binding domain-containing protein [Thermodesulfobium sp. 4217-1]